MIKNILALFCIFSAIITSAQCATVIANVNNNPITDDDIKARVTLMTKQGTNSATNMQQAFKNIVDDYVKLNYAANFNIKPTDEDAEKELGNLNLGDLDANTKSMAIFAIKADMAWQVIIGQTIIPTINVTKADINAEKVSLAKEHGLPMELKLIRLVDIPENIASKLTKPSSCDDALNMAKNLGGDPQSFTALQYELSADIRERVADLPILTWSKRKDNSVLLICEAKKTSEYKNLDDIIKQNAMYKQDSNIAEKQLKQLRRKAIIIINDNRYSL
ncbi:MAG: hypothetical protein MJ158_00175 [Alphaproteobacteria bacterium]|nr:hypothetical protein [Alphaproteobacteria bacterium]